MLRILFSRYIVWGYQSDLESRVSPKYFICVTVFIFLSLTMGWFMISKAFDVVPYYRLLTKIAEPGVDLWVVLWVEEFLLGRSQSTRV